MNTSDSPAPGAARLPGRGVLAGAAATCLLLCVLGGMLAVTSYRNGRSGAVSRTELRCRVAAAEVYGDRIGLVRLLQALASDPALQAGDGPAIAGRLTAVGGEAFGFTGGLAWIDTTGTTVASTRGSVGGPPGGEWWREVVGTGEWATTPAVTAPAFAGEVLVVAVPTLDAEGSVNGVLAGGLGTGWLRSTTADQARQFGTARYGEQTELFLADTGAHLTAGPDVEATGDLSGSATYRLIMQRRAGSTHGVLVGVPGLTGRPDRVVAWAGTGSFGELVILERSAASALARPLRLVRLRLAALAVAILLIMVGAVLGARRADRRARQREELHRAEHAVVVDLQHTLLAASLPPGASARYLPASSVLNVGGDWYDVISLPGGRLLLVVGDVVGHGVRAALAMGQVRTATRALATGVCGPAELLTELDRYVASMEDVLFCTAVCLLVDPPSGGLRYATAGHPPALLRGADGTVAVLEGTGGMPLGLTAAADWDGWGDGSRREARLPVTGEELLVLYTDGLVERRGETIDTGIARLATAVAEHRPGAGDWCDRVIGQALDGVPPSDDLVLLSFRLSAATRGPEHGL